MVGPYIYGRMTHAPIHDRDASYRDASYTDASYMDASYTDVTKENKRMES